MAGLLAVQICFLSPGQGLYFKASASVPKEVKGNVKQYP